MAANTCESWDFANLTQLQFFVNATWYGDYYKSDFMAALNWDETEFEGFFNVTQNNSFGYQLAQVNKNNSEHYNCSSVPTEFPYIEDGNNCTAGELTLLQWGSSGVTLDPFYLNNNYTKTTYSMAKDWGIYPIDFVSEAPEYSYWANEEKSVSGTDIAPLNKNQTAILF